MTLRDVAQRQDEPSQAKPYLYSVFFSFQGESLSTGPASEGGTRHDA
jgi:hypothetical protein